VLEADSARALFRREPHASTSPTRASALLPEPKISCRSVDYAERVWRPVRACWDRSASSTGTVASTVIYAGIYSRFVRQYPRIDFRLTSASGSTSRRDRSGRERGRSIRRVPRRGDSDLEAEVLGTTELGRGRCARRTHVARDELDASAAAAPPDERGGRRGRSLHQRYRAAQAFRPERAGVAIVPRWSVSAELRPERSSSCRFICRRCANQWGSSTRARDARRHWPRF